MPRPRFQKMATARRRALLDAARKEFSSREYGSASINTILADAGFSKGSFYHYFDDKTDLAATVVLEVYAPLVALLRGTKMPRTAASFWRDFRESNLRMTELIEAHGPTYDLLINVGNELLENTELAARVLPSMGEVMDHMIAIWKQGQKLGAVRTDLPVSELLAAQDGLKRSLWKARFPKRKVPEHAELERFVDDFLDLLQRICRPARRAS